MIQSFRAIWVGVVLLAALSASALAQDGDQTDSTDRITFRAEFGYANGLVPNRWNLVRVWVSSGTRSVQGTVEIRYATDPTQEHRAIAPFATTPGKAVPVELLVCPYEYTRNLTLRVIPDRGRRPKAMRFRTDSWSADNLNVPLRDMREALVLSIADTGVRHAVTTQRSRNALDSPIDGARRSSNASPEKMSSESLWNEHARVHRVTLENVPTHWAAYDAARVVVIMANDAELLAPDAIDQIKLWTRSGGRLVVLADTPGSAWQRWFDDDFKSLPIHMNPPEPLVPSGAIAHVFEDLQDDLPEGLAPALAEEAPSRRISLTDGGLAHGWRLRWRDQSGGGETGLLAEGPMGFGTITVLGVDPERVSDVLSSLAQGLVWQDALESSVADWQAEAAESQVSNLGFGIQSSRYAITNSEVVAGLVDFRSTGNAAFFVIALGIFALAMALGPVDALVLKRLRQRHRSWLTALGWITIAGGIAYLAPSLIRAGPAKLRQIQMVDTIQRSGERESILSARVEVFGIFANQSGEAQLSPVHDASLTSGISALSNPYDNSQRIVGVFDTVQQLAQKIDDAQPLGSALDRIRLNLWTFRTFLKREPPVQTDDSIVAEFTRGAGHWMVTIDGLPPSSFVDEVLMHTADGFHSVKWDSSDEPLLGEDQTRWEGVFAVAGRLNPPAEWGELGARERSQNEWNPWQAPVFRFDSAISLAGADRRGLSIRQRVESGRWVCVYVGLLNLPGTLDIEGWNTETHRRTLLRMVVPIAQGDMLEPSASFLRSIRD